MISQKELLERVSNPGVFTGRYPIWKCPCGHLNRFCNTFGETCSNCGADHTLDWMPLVVEAAQSDDRNPPEVQRAGTP